MAEKRTSELHIGEEPVTQDREDVDRDNDQASNVDESRYGVQERVENDVEPLGLLQKPQNSRDSQDSQHGDVDRQGAAGDHAVDSSKNHQEVEDVPSTLKVQSLVGYDLEDALSNENVVEDVLE